MRMIHSTRLLLSAILTQDIDELKPMLTLDACRGCFNLSGLTLLHVACDIGCLEIVRLLIPFSFVEARNNYGLRPIHMACRRGHSEIVNELILQGSAVDHPDDTEVTPLILACQFEQMSVVKLLVSHKAQINRTTKSGMTALMMVCQKGHLGIAQFLVSFKVDLKQLNSNYQGLISIAILNGKSLDLGLYLIGHLLRYEEDIEFVFRELINLMTFLNTDELNRDTQMNRSEKDFLLSKASFLKFLLRFRTTDQLGQASGSAILTRLLKSEVLVVSIFSYI